MRLILTAEQSALWDEGGFSAWRVEEDIVEQLIREEITDQVVVELDDGSIAFAITAGEDRL